MNILRLNVLGKNHIRTGLFFLVIMFIIPVSPLRATLRIGPMKAVEYRVEKLDESVNEHWVDVWELNCSGVGNYSADKECALDAGITARVIKYWNKNPNLAPADFTVDPGDGVTEARFTLIDEPFGEREGTDYGKLAWADVNRNGLLDLAVAGRDSDGNARLVIFENLGNGEFSIAAEPMEGAGGLRSAALAWGDFNNSGYLDLAVLGHDQGDENGSPRLIVFRNDGNFQFAIAGQPLGDDAGLERGDLIWLDFDNDGLEDLVVAGFDGSNPRFIVFENSTDLSEGTEVEITLNPVQYPFGDTDGLSNFSALAAGDFNNNGWLDIAVLGRDASWNNRLVVMQNNGADSGTKRFAEEGDTGFYDITDIGGVYGLSRGDLAWGDISADGSLELIAIGLDPWNRGQVYVLEYANKSFAEANIANDLIGLRYSSISLGDYNNSGYTDVLLSGRDDAGYNRMLVYENLEGDELRRSAEPMGLKKGLWRGVSAWADFDESGRLGLVGSGYDGEENRLVVFANNTDISKNNRPSRPNITGVQVYSDTVVLHWSAPADWETESHSLSYSIRVGTAPGRVDVVGEGSKDSHQYYNRLLGRIHPGRTSAILYNLPPGSYYWSVRAIDSGYKMSRWSEEEDFEF